jgi:xylan 1,4-beta-xylosidase
MSTTLSNNMKIKFIIVNIVTISLLVCNVAKAQTTTLINPILSGFYPDPSIVQVNKDYYLVNSTFSYYPGIPVFHSKDLKNWKQMGSVITRNSQMNFIGERMTRGLFAPAINYNKGIFYITCTNIDHKGNFIVTSKNPAGPWSDPIWLPKVHGIDPSLFFDDNGKAYIIYNSDAPDNKPLYSGHRTIRMYELDVEHLQVLGEEKLLVNGGVDISKKPVWIEGPHIMKRNNWYYLYAAEGGTSVNHTEVVFRSKSIGGPFIPYENNPILTQKDLPENRKNPITSTGHAQFVEGPDGKTYAIFLGCRPYSGNYYNTGRETFIAPVEWKNDWPIINPDNKEVSYSYTVNYPSILEKNSLPQSGNFQYTIGFEKEIDQSLLFLRSVDSSSFSFGKSAGLTLKLKPETMMEFGVPSFVGKRQQHLFCTTETALNFTSTAENEQAGLVVFQDEKHFYFLSQSFENGDQVLQLFKSNKDGKTMDLIAKVPIHSKKVQLRIDAVGEYYDFYYATSSKNWILLKDKLDAKYLSTQEAGGFIGCIFGLYATSSGKPSTNNASFQYLKYSGNDAVYK